MYRKNSVHITKYTINNYDNKLKLNIIIKYNLKLNKLLVQVYLKIFKQNIQTST